MRHADFRKELNLWLDGRRGTPLSPTMQQHAYACESCREEMEKLIALDDAMCLQQNVVVPASFSSLAERIIAGERTRVNSQKPLRPWLPGWVVFPTAVVLSLWGMSLFTPPLTSVLLQCLITLVGVYLLAVRQGMMRT